MIKNKIIVKITFAIVFVCVAIFTLNNSKVFAETEDYTQQYEGGYAVSFSNYNENSSSDPSELGTVDAVMTFTKQMAEDANIPNPWTKVNSNTISATLGQASYCKFSVRMEDDTSINVVLVAPFKLEKGAWIKNISLSTFEMEPVYTLNITSSNPEVLSVEKNGESFNVTAIEEGSATLTGELIPSHEEFLGGVLTTKGFVVEKSQNPDSGDGENEDDDENDYALIDNSPYITGPNTSLKKVGKPITANLAMYKVSANRVIEIDNSKVKVEVSNPDLVSVENQTIIAKSEGYIDVTYKYTYKGKEYTLKEKYVIYNPDDKFELGLYAVLSNSIVNLKAGGTAQKVSFDFLLEGTYGISYPEGYDHDTYFKSEWSVEDSKVAKIEENNDGSVLISGLSAGKTKAILTIKTADGEEEIKKNVQITVSGNSSDNGSVGEQENTDGAEEQEKDDEPVKQENTHTEENDSNNGKKDGTEYPDKLAQAGTNTVILFVIASTCIVAVGTKYRLSKLSK